MTYNSHLVVVENREQTGSDKMLFLYKNTERLSGRNNIGGVKMRVCVIQPFYSLDYNDADKCFAQYTGFLDACDESADIIVLPEYCDVPVSVPDGEKFYELVNKYNKEIMDKCVMTAKRCKATVFVNCAYKTAGGWRNTTHAINSDGNVVGRYFKAHPAPSELKAIADGGNGLDCDYEKDPTYTIDIDGIRFGFRTCYDFYFFEDLIPLARKKPDIIIGCSHQRTDTHAALELIDRFLCYNTNAYLVRSSVSLGADSDVCGCSCVIAPDGSVIKDMKNCVGIAVVDIDPKKKYYKPAGFKGEPSAHWEYVDMGRADAMK